MAESESRPTFLETLAVRPVVFDGAMGTMLYEQGYFINRAFDEANLVKPDTVRKIHEAHKNAGAEVIETNTFSANRFLLARYGVDDKVVEINRAGARLAREAAGSDAWVAGAVGPTGEGLGVMPEYKQRDVRLAYEEQVTALVEEGVDILLLETFQHLREMRIAVEVARGLFKGPLMAQMSFQEDGHLLDGTAPLRVADLLVAWGADVIGVNCCEGPAIVHDVAAEMVKAGHPVSAMPNAGRPRRLDQRTLYMATAEYFGVFAKRMLKSGVRVVGGCCGTRPEHVAAVAAAVRMVGGGPARVQVSGARSQPATISVEGVTPVPTEEKSQLASKVMRVWQERLGCGARAQAPSGPDDFVVSVEVNPAPGLSTAKPMKAARMLKAAGIDVINIADGPRAAVRMSNTALALTMQKELDTEVILHVCCRDRNLLGLQSEILGAHVLGLKNLVVITGDPPKMGDYPKATAVFDLDSIELLKLVEGLNHGIDPAGKMVGEATSFFLATGAEPGAFDYEREVNRLEMKVKAGAEMVMTQPVYDAAVVERFLDSTRSLGVPVLLGICPLVSHRNAEFLHNEVPGMSVPEGIRSRMERAGAGASGVAEGVAIAREMVAAFSDRVVGCYVMPQLGRYGTAVDVLQPVGYEPGGAP
ncbi:MAG: bifunctional homocysteine S-methyltransferase/methylenetetrahydrofolate reductase [Planctomycetota bacterium]|nr:bifunctional homocysteine S-methyltransferase/methylenetetrahydrofolate reductase [Planctomycetota bacterium]MEE2713534.1 bifunctional homocysteine S-methyltransferase/methylenetetrahydrofolate reductase [Planctomycetota bacterium]